MPSESNFDHAAVSQEGGCHLNHLYGGVIHLWSVPTQQKINPEACTYTCLPLHRQLPHHMHRKLQAGGSDGQTGDGVGERAPTTDGFFSFGIVVQHCRSAYTHSFSIVVQHDITILIKCAESWS